MSRQTASRISSPVVALFLLAGPLAAGGEPCGEFYCWLDDDPVIDDKAHLGTPGERPPGTADWELQHSHVSYKYNDWHDYAKDGYLEDSEEGVHTVCTGGN